MKVIIERKGTGERSYCPVAYYKDAKTIYEYVQRTVNKNNDYLVWIED